MSTRTDLIIQKIIGQMNSQNAQELYLTVGKIPVIRQDGELHDLVDFEVVTEDLVQELAQTMLTPEEQKELSSEKSLITIKEIGTIGRFRVHLYYQKNTITMTVKLIMSVIPKLSEINLQNSLLKLVNLRQGLVLISGPYDSGRSTVAASILQQIAQEKSIRILTIENPLEYIFESQHGLVEQRQVGRDVKSFSGGLELARQEDIEVVFVSEVPDTETAQSLIKLALSERLVFALLDSDSAIRTLEAFLDKANEDSQVDYASHLADALQAVVNLRLLPRQGMPGRVYATEILLNSSPIALALKDKDFSRMLDTLQTSRKEGMVTLDQSLLDLVKKGYVSKEAVLAVSHNQNDLLDNLK